MIVFIIAYSVGSTLVQIDASQTKFIKAQFQEQIKGINQYGIFANNARVALEMFIPGHGVYDVLHGTNVVKPLELHSVYPYFW